MKNKDLKLGLITTALYLTGVAALLSIMACIGSFMQIGGFERYINAEYAVGIIIGSAASFACGYIYHPMLTKAIAKYSQSNPDIPMKYVEGVCRSKLLSYYSGYTAAACLSAAILTFAFTKETYIEALCLLMSIGFISILICLHYKFRSREIMHDRFRSMPI